MADKAATFTVKFDDDGSTADAGAMAGELDRLRQQIDSSTAAMKRMSAAQRSLRGDTNEVKSARADLKAKIGAERDSISAANLAILKQGRTYEGLSAQAKRAASEKSKLTAATKNGGEKQAADAMGSLNAAIGKAGGPLAGLSAQFSSLKELMGDGVSGAAGVAVFAIGALVAITAKLAQTVAEGAVSLIKWIVVTADAARSARLLRDAAFGNEQWGKNFGDQVDLLARKVPLTKAQLDELGKGLAKQNIGGQTWVDTMTAVAHAAAALGDDAGAKLRSFIERGRQFGRLRLNPQELIGTGVTFDEVARALGGATQKGVAEARLALLDGRVKLADGAAALRSAVEKKFGAINAKQMLSLPNIAAKFKESLARLASDVDLEPLLNGLHELAQLFDTSTVSGKAIKAIVTSIGNAISDVAKRAVPPLKEAFLGMVIVGLTLQIAFLQVRNAIRAFARELGIKGEIDIFGAVGTQLGNVLNTIALAARGAVTAIVTFLRVTLLLVGAVRSVLDAGAQVKTALTSWISLGKDLVGGLAAGIRSGASDVIDSVKKIGDDAKKALKEVWDAHSPSKAFERIGRSAPQGAASGIDAEAPSAAAAVERMARNAMGAYGARAAASGPSITIAPGAIVIQAGSGDAAALADALTDRAFTKKLTEALVTMARGAGVEVET